MARDISELGADVIDDTPVDPKHKMSAKRRNYIIGGSIGGALLVGAIIATVILCNTALSDYSNVEKVMYYITPTSELKEGEKPGAVLYKLNSSYKYKSTFRIPSQVKGYPVIGVANEAFSGHQEIKKIVMPNSLRFVGTRAFYNCQNLSSFTWSKNLVEVGVDAFANTKFYTNLSKDKSGIFKLPAGMLVYAGEDYFESGTALVSDEISEAEINDIKTRYSASNVSRFSSLGITGICSGVFKNNDKIVYIDFFRDIDVVYDYTFSGCKNLKGVDLTHSNINTLSLGCFKDSTKLKDIKLSDKVTTIADYVFANTGLTSDIPDLSHVTSLGSYIFADCASLQQLTYDSTIVPNYLFSGCSSLSLIEWGQDNSNIDQITKIGVGAFEGTNFSTFIVPKNVTVINDYLFQNCLNLKTVKLYGNPTWHARTGEQIDPEEYDYDEEGHPIMPTFIDDSGVSHEGILDGVSVIKAAAFKGCAQLDTIGLYGDDYLDMPGQPVEGQFTFPYSLQKTDVSTTIEGKNNYVFSGSKVQKVVISPNQSTIGSFAFFGVDTLNEVQFLYPEQSKLTTIADAAFENCTGLTSISIPANVSTLKSSVFRGCTNLVTADIKNTKIKSVSPELFYECTSLSHVDLPSTVTVLKKSAFYKTTSLDYLIIPSGVTSIEKGSVAECRTGDEKLPIYLELTYEDAVENIARYSENLFDENCKVYYFLEGEKVPGRNYWKYNSSDQPEVIPND